MRRLGHAPSVVAPPLRAQYPAFQEGDTMAEVGERSEPARNENPTGGESGALAQAFGPVDDTVLRLRKVDEQRLRGGGRKVVRTGADVARSPMAKWASPPNGACVGATEAGQAVEEGGLPARGRADDGQPLACAYHERHATE